MKLLFALLLFCCGICHAQQPEIFEGYLCDGFKCYDFIEIKNGNVQEINGYISKSEINRDSLLTTNNFYKALYAGVYVKIEGVKEDTGLRQGLDFSYHYILHVNKILKIDVEKTLKSDYLKLLEKGYVTGKDTIRLPNDFVPGEKYFFKGENNPVILEIEQTAQGVLEYQLASGKGKTIASGRMELDAYYYLKFKKHWPYPEPYRFTYSSAWYDEVNSCENRIIFFVPVENIDHEKLAFAIDYSGCFEGEFTPIHEMLKEKKK